jgi:cytochrome c oxidase subunit 3
MSSTTHARSGPGERVVISGNEAAVSVADDRSRIRSSVALVSKAEPSETGVWVGIATISMFFAALTSALFVRQGAASDWRHFELPPVLYFNTLILLASSITLELSRRRFAEAWGPSAVEPRTAKGAEASGRLRGNAIFWFYVTVGLGLIFIVGQCVAWFNLSRQGLFMATSPSSSFFYVLTAMHGLHLLGGVAGLIYVLRRLSRNAGSEQRSALGAASLYWHFMDGLWVYLLFLLAVKM